MGPRREYIKKVRNLALHRHRQEDSTRYNKINSNQTITTRTTATTMPSITAVWHVPPIFLRVFGSLAINHICF